MNLVRDIGRLRDLEFHRTSLDDSSLRSPEYNLTQRACKCDADVGAKHRCRRLFHRPRGNAVEVRHTPVGVEGDESIRYALEDGADSLLSRLRFQSSPLHDSPTHQVRGASGQHEPAVDRGPLPRGRPSVGMVVDGGWIDSTDNAMLQDDVLIARRNGNQS